MRCAKYLDGTKDTKIIIDVHIPTFNLINVDLLIGSKKGKFPLLTYTLGNINLC